MGPLLNLARPDRFELPTARFVANALANDRNRKQPLLALSGEWLLYPESSHSDASI
jgi:hypothetical protein